MTDNGLPNGWRGARIRDVFKVVGGGTPSTGVPRFWDGTIPWVTSADLESSLRLSPRKFITPEAVQESATNLVPKDSVIVATRVGLGKVGIAERDTCFSQDCQALLPALDLVEPRFAAHQLSVASREFHHTARGTTISGVTKKQLLDLEFRYPELQEQRRVVAKIEQLFSHLDAGVAALERAKANLARYRATVLKAAVEGKLTEQWRREHPSVEPASELMKQVLAERRKKWEEEQLKRYKLIGRRPPKGWRERYREPPMDSRGSLPKLPDSWCWTTFGAVAEVQLGKMLSRKAFEPGLKQYPYLRNQNVRWFNIDRSDLKQMGFNAREVEKFQLRSGDLLICEGGEPGRCAVFSGHHAPLMYQKALHRLRPYGGYVSAHWLQFCLAHFVWSRRILPRYSETTIQHLPLEKLISSPVPLAPAAEQQLIVGILDEQVSLVDEQVAQLHQVTARAATLRQAVLGTAFEGKLS